MDDLSLGALFSGLAVLIIMSAFFSSAETGMMSLNRYRLKHLSQNGHRGARRAARLLKRPDKLISLILIGNNLVNFITASLFTVVAIRLWGDAGVAVAPVILTVVVLIFAEITPKTIAALYPEKVAFPATHALQILMKLLLPVVWMMNHITNGLLKIINVDPSNSNNEQLSSEELRTIVGEAGPMIPKRHQKMLLNILDLEMVSVDDIMIPRNEVEGLDLDDDDQSLLEQLRQSEFTRMPVYQNDINNVIGVLHQRDVSCIIDQQGNIDRASLLEHIQEPYFIPESTPLHTQLLNFQKKKLRMGIVVDEYGVVQGIVTLEDILEEIVGEFTSNLADDSEDIRYQTDGSYLIDGSATIRDINKALHWELPTEGPKTLNGLLLEHLEAFPDAEVGMRIGPYHFEVLEIKDNILQTARASRPGKPQDSKH